MLIMFGFLNQAHASSCDDGTHAIIDQFDGVNIYSNSPYTGNSDGLGDCQCVELISRFYGISHTGDGGSVIYTLHNEDGFNLYENGSTNTKPQPGDVISFAYGSAGHVALVVEVTDSAVVITDQNWTDNPSSVRKTLTLTHNLDNTYTVGNLGNNGSYVTEGWARDPDYTPPGGSTTASVHLMSVEPNNRDKFNIYGYEVSGSGNTTTLSGDYFQYLNTGNTTTILSWLSGDVDGDDWDDVVQVRVKNGYTYAQVYIADGEGGLNPQTRWKKTSGTATQAYLVDMNNDDLADLVFGFTNSDDTMTWKYFTSTGSGFTDATTWSSSFGKSSDIFVMGDFNGNGKAELLRGREDDGVTDDNFTSAMTWKRLDTSGNTSTVLNSYGYSADQYLVTDADSDGDADLIRIDLADNTVTAYVIKYSNSSNEFGTATIFATDVGENTSVYYTYPIDYSDAYSDLIRYDTSAAIRLVQSSGGTAFEGQSGESTLVSGMNPEATYLFGNFGVRTSTSIQSVNGVTAEAVDEDDLLDPTTFTYSSLDLTSEAAVGYSDLYTNVYGYVHPLTGMYRVIFTGDDGNIFEFQSSVQGEADTWAGRTLSAYYWVPYVLDTTSTYPFLDLTTGDEYVVFSGDTTYIWTMTSDGTTGGITSTNVSGTVATQYSNTSSDPMGYVDPNTGDIHLIFVDRYQHVWQLIQDGLTGTWTSQDLSSLTGLTVYANTSAQGFMDPLIGDHYVLFTGSDKRIKLLISSDTSTWSAADLSSLAPVDYTVSTPMGFVHPLTEEFYVYLLGENERVYEIHYNLSTWSGTDLSSQASVPYGMSGTGLSAVVNPLTGDILVTFQGDNQRVNQFRYRDDTWTATDLTSQAAVDWAAPTTTPTTCIDPFTGAELTVFNGENQRIQYLRYGP
jgi:hypothetical protein